MSLSAPRVIRLREDTRLGASRVDRKARVIYGVKVLGPSSRNRRRYLPEAIRAAIPLYEGVKVRKDHPDDPDDCRPSDDIVGWLRNVRLSQDGGILADLHYLESHPFTPRLLEAAERNSSLFALSHNADGEVDSDENGMVVKAITEVRSVDIVDGPATTRGLFESYSRPREASHRHKPSRGRTMKLREWFDRIRLLPPARRTIRRLMEGGYMDGEMNMPVREAEGDLPPPDGPLDAPPMDDVESAGPLGAHDPAEMDPEEALRSGFSAAWNAVFGDTTLDQKAKIKRAKELIDAYERLTAGGETIPEQKDEEKPAHKEPDEDDEVPIPEEECEGEMKPEKMKEQLDRYKAREKARELLDREGVPATSALLEALSRLPSDAARLELIGEVKAPYKARTAPLLERTGRGGRTGHDEDEPKNAEEFARRLLMNN